MPDAAARPPTVNSQIIARLTSMMDREHLSAERYRMWSIEAFETAEVIKAGIELLMRGDGNAAGALEVALPEVLGLSSWRTWRTHAEQMAALRERLGIPALGDEASL